MAAAQPIDFAAMMPGIVSRLLPEPNPRLSTRTELRFGTNGSLAVDLEKGSYFDHEAKAGGGALDLIQRERRCDPAGALAWLEAEGLKDREPQAVWQLGSRKLQSQQSGTIEGPIFYVYRDEEGEPLSRVKRTPDKRFSQQAADGRGGFVATPGCMSGVRRVPYRLPELLAADANRTVFVVEGEKDADRLASLGFVATTSAEGAGKFRSELVEHFADRTVVVVADNDEAGRSHAADVVAKLAGVAWKATILALPDLPPKGDVSDWLDKGGTVEQLKDLARASIEQPVTALDTPPAETFPLADLAMWSGIPATPKSFLMAGYVPANELTLATGAGGANKSTFGQQLATCMAAGRPMLGVDVQEGEALYITAEDGEDQLHWRQEHICKALNVRMADLAGKLHLVSLRGRLGNELATFDGEGKLRTTASFQMLRATIAATKPKLVVLDNTAHLYAGNENDRGQVTAFVNALYSFCVDLGVTIILVAHTNKAGDSYSGSTAWLNAVRSQILLSIPDGTADRDERLLSLGKANYARQGQELRFRWYDFALILDTDLPIDRRDELAANALANGDNAAFLNCLRERNRQGEGRQVGPAPGPNYAPTQFEGMAQAQGLKKDRLKKAMDRLYTINAIETHVYQNTAKGRDVSVIREVGSSPNSHPEPFPNTGPDLPRTSRPNHPAHTLSPKGGTGAAFGSRAPDQITEREYVGGNPALGPVKREPVDFSKWENDRG